MRAVWCSLLLLAACDIGNGPGGGGGGGGGNNSDAAIDGHGPIWADAPIGGGSNGPCENQVTSVPDGHHNTGKDCEQGCHNHGFTLSGTLYTGANNNTGFPGATITVTDAQNRVVKIVTRSDGNFYTSQAIAFPAVVRASACPLGTSMVATVSNGRCNSSACHAQQTAAQMHLP